jgi:cytochrome oxidase Cu insertion factor (SCO1/SenC/PrrC family)
MNTPSPRAIRNSRLKFLLVVFVFVAPIMVAAILNMTDWQPTGKAYGQPIFPQRNFLQPTLPITLADGKTWPWRDTTPRLTLIALAGPDCARQCLDTLTKMAAARITLNSNMARLRLLYVGTPPADANSDGMKNYWALGTDTHNQLADFRPTQPDSVTALLVESDGTALSLYPAGFDPSGLRKDLQRIIH